MIPSNFLASPPYHTFSLSTWLTYASSDCIQNRRPKDAEIKVVDVKFWVDMANHSVGQHPQIIVVDLQRAIRIEQSRKQIKNLLWGSSFLFPHPRKSEISRFFRVKTHIQIAGIYHTDIVLRNLAYFWGLKWTFSAVPARHGVLIDLSKKHYSRLLMNTVHCALRVVSAISNQLYKNIKDKIISNGNSLFFSSLWNPKRDMISLLTFRSSKISSKQQILKNFPSER